MRVISSNLHLAMILWLFGVHSSCHEHKSNVDRDDCALPDKLVKEIDDYAPIVNEIISAAVNGTFKGSTWRELSVFVDKFGPRLAGTPVLEDSIDYLLNRSVELELENVHGEAVAIPHWVRGAAESATLLEPRRADIAILGLGGSVGTPAEGITAEAIVVRNFAELEERREEVPGKIVVYDQEFESYGKTVVYRTRGATEAAKLGAKATLVRSITPFSMYTPHTGWMAYDRNVTKIPAASITVEDAGLLHRMSERGEKIMIKLKMEARNLPEAKSRNGIAEITGNRKPQQVVVVSGHIDSWDVGQGAMDDGGGLFVSWNALVLLNALKLRPQRTIRAIMWTAEEVGVVGAEAYIKAHKFEESNIRFVMESDEGTFAPVGLSFTGSKKVGCILKRVMRLLTPLGATKLRSPHGGPDIADWVTAGVPGASLWTKNDRYFWYHHTNADTMLVENSHSLDQGTAMIAAVSYVLADLSAELPRHDAKRHRARQH